MTDRWVINSTPALVAFIKTVERTYSEHKFITYTEPRIGPDRSISQNALLHVFLSEYAAYILKRDKKEVAKDRGLMEGMKLDAKKKFVLHHPENTSWMVHEVIGPMSGSKKKAYTSSSNWKRGEMFVFLTWLQMLAANDGLILESKGEFNKLQREQNV